jgi:hypothetical protein
MRTLRSLAAPVALLAAITLAGCGSASNDDKPESKPSESKSAEVKHTIEVTYDEPLDGPGESYVATLAAGEGKSAQGLAEEILKAGEIDGIADGFADNFNLPEDLKIHVSNEDGSPFYDPTTKTITVFYDFANLTANIIKASQTSDQGSIDDTELGKQWAAVNDFVLIHELAHAFVDVLEIPVTGREEDAADGMATYFFTDYVPNGPEYAFAAATFFAALQDFQGSPDATQFADEHSLSIQRAGDIACKVAGSSDENMQIVAQIGGGLLTEARLARCPAEYEQMSKAWSALLKPHLRASDDADDSDDSGDSGS